MALPFYLVAKVTLKGGVRLPPKKKWVSEPQQENRYLPSVYQQPKKQKPDEVYDVELGFVNWEFRYWAIERHGTMPAISVCRCCGDTEMSKEKRRQHHDKHGCTKTLHDAYKELAKDRKCVMCDAYTTNTEWGVPICNVTACITKWKFEPDPMPLVEALSLVGLRQGA
jgi:hypothetical protein